MHLDMRPARATLLLFAFGRWELRNGPDAIRREGAVQLCDTARMLICNSFPEVRSQGDRMGLQNALYSAWILAQKLTR
jgi:hypothetical protein